MLYKFDTRLDLKDTEIELNVAIETTKVLIRFVSFFPGVGSKKDCKINSMPPFVIFIHTDWVYYFVAYNSWPLYFLVLVSGKSSDSKEAIDVKLEDAISDRLSERAMQMLVVNIMGNRLRHIKKNLKVDVSASLSATKT